MPSYVVKVNKHEDRYCIWSTVTESPHFWGTESDVIKYLLEDHRHRLTGDVLHEVGNRMLRAKANGTSALDRDYGWDEGFIVEQRGFLKRDGLGKFLDSFDPVTQHFDYSMLEPFEDE